MNMIPAARATQKYRPAFLVTKLEGEFEKVIYKMVPFGNKKDKDGNPKNYHLEKEVVKEPRGWLITFPKSRPEHTHSIHVSSLEEMERLGFTNTEVPIVDEDGEPVGSVPNVVRKERKEKVDA